MRHFGEILASLFFMLVGIGVTIGGIELRVGTATEPKAGFFPFLGGIALMALSVILGAQAWSGRTPGTKAFGDLWRPVSLVIGLVIYAALFDILGYIVATAILSVITLCVLETKKWWVVIALSLTLAIGSYILFDRVLGVTLPKGILEGLF